MKVCFFPANQSDSEKSKRPKMKTSLNRRQFLKWMGISSLSLLLQQCGLRTNPGETPAAASTTPAPFITLPASETAIPPTVTPQPTATSSYQSTAAIGQINTYEVTQVRAKLEEMFQQLGGLADVVRPGARVTIKPNLTGSTWTDSSLPAPATELFVTHPALVQALAEILIDAGAGQIRIADGLGDEAIFQAWGYTDVAARVNAQLVDLCKPAPYSDFVTFPVGPARQVYDNFYMNAALKEVDVFISFAKMKCHSTTGVTLSLKNLIGIAPISLYRREASHNHRSAFHESTAYDRRLPCVAIDLNLAVPVHLALVDGIKTVEAGAGAWDSGYNPVQPGLLVASKNPVAADAVSANIMGFDPDAPSGTHPFSYADNHLALAREAGLGTNRLAEIGVVGAQIAEVVYPFKTVR
jgi:uncharacterized protein (DUF362 family)